ncbi:hypothetical protein [Paraburkholderia sp. RL17-337-BIB-A]|uniref:hypothetical protein n=1 Tax=Paraburkholderia sp. RL17-337-BIB-A TaxID=3031636 RepID=UPI0038B99983
MATSYFEFFGENMPIDEGIANAYEAFVPEGEQWLASYPDATYGGVDNFQGVSTGMAKGTKAAHELWIFRLIKQFCNGVWDFNELNSFDGFEKFHAAQVKSYKEYWVSEYQKTLSHHTALRLVDLSIKWFRRTNDERVRALDSTGLAAAVRKYGHTVLNEPGQGLLKLLFIDEPRYRETGTTEEIEASYQAMQARIREFCALYGGSPLVVDVFARARHVR